MDSSIAGHYYTSDHTAKGPGMTEITYFPQVRCKVADGYMPGFVSAEIQDRDGRTLHVPVTRDFVSMAGAEAFLPIGIVEIDRTSRRVLIELPTESLEGANRLWISFDDLKHSAEAGRA